LLFPQTTIAADGITNITLQVVLEVVNITNMDTFASNFLYSQYFTFRSIGTATLVATNGFTVNGVPFDKYTTLKGMDGLTEITVTEFDMNDSTNENLAFHVSLILINPSGLRLNLSTVNTDSYQNGNLVGYGTIENFNLVPGPNYMQINGTLSTTNVAELINLINLRLTGNPGVVTNKISNLGSTPYILQSALASFSLIINIPGSTLPVVHSIDFVEMTLAPNGDSSFIYQSAGIVTLNPQIGDQVNVELFELAVQMAIYNADGAPGIPQLTPDLCHHLTFSE